MSSKQPQYTELDLLEAIEEYKTGKFKSMRAAAASRLIPEATFRHRYQGNRQNRQKAHEHQQLLNREQEDILVQWIINMSEWGLAPRRWLVMEMAYRVADRHALESLTGTIGQHWYRRFVQRNASRISSSLSVCLEKNRHVSCSREAFVKFYELVSLIFPILFFLLNFFRLQGY